MEKLKTNKRIKYIDIARGIAIILMIAGHVCSNGWKRNIIFSFHMPLFIIVSGVFFKESESLKDTIIKLLKNLILPYSLAIIITQIAKSVINNQQLEIWDLIKQIIFAYSNKKTFFLDIQGVGVLWFIPFLAISKIVFFMINKLSKEDNLLKGILCMVCTFIGIYLSKKKIYLPWSFDVALASIIFFYVGYMLKKYNLIENILSNYKIMISIILLYCIGIKFGFIELAMRSYPNGLIAYMTAICGTLIVFEIAKIIEKLLNDTTKVLSWFGRNSMYILCLHHFERVIIRYEEIGITEKYLIFIMKMLIVTFLTFILVQIRKNVMERRLGKNIIT